jgi:hypothetical protein
MEKRQVATLLRPKGYAGSSPVRSAVGKYIHEETLYGLLHVKRSASLPTDVITGRHNPESFNGRKDRC